MEKLYGILRRLWYTLTLTLAVIMLVFGIAMLGKDSNAIDWVLAGLIYIPLVAVSIHWLVRWILFGDFGFPLKK